ncbi:MAG: universal stress protein [Acidobacteria bacterium]|nr:universal stress protein [Acidobacteriota bacterium]
MLPFRKILFPVDFSDRCRGAAAYVESLAARFSSEVVLLHVVEPAAEAYSPLEASHIEFRKSELDCFLDGSFSHAPVHRVLVVGDPAKKIVAYAHDHGVDLIAMPTHGYGPFRRFILGSVTAKVLHDAECPVWTGVHLEEAPQTPVALRSIVSAVDLDNKALNIVTKSAGLAREYGARLTIAHAIPSIDVRPDMYLDVEFRASLIETAKGELEALRRTVGIEATLCVETGDIAKVVRYSAERHRADLLVIGRSSPGLLGRLRTHAYSLVRESPCPVLSL